MSDARGLFRLKCLCFPRAGRIPLRRAKRGTSPVRRGGMPPSVGFADTSPGGGGYPYAVMVNKVTLCRVAGEVSLYPKWLTRQVHMKDAGIQSIPQDVHCAVAERSHVVESAKPGKSPPRGRGNERFLLSFNGCVRSARLPELSVTRLRAGEILCILVVQPSRAALAETSVPDPRERYPKNFFCPFPACRTHDSSASRIPGEPRSPAPACRG